jgi:hypothetical protein
MALQFGCGSYGLDSKIALQRLGVWKGAVPEGIVWFGKGQEKGAACFRDDRRCVGEITSGEVKQIGVLPKGQNIHGEIARQRPIAHEQYGSA